MLAGYGLVLVMGAGNYLGTRFALSGFLVAAACLMRGLARCPSSVARLSWPRIDVHCGGHDSASAWRRGSAPGRPGGGTSDGTKCHRARLERFSRFFRHRLGPPVHGPGERRGLAGRLARPAALRRSWPRPIRRSRSSSRPNSRPGSNRCCAGCCAALSIRNGSTNEWPSLREQ